MTLNQQIFDICDQLSKRNIEPSVGLVRAKLSDKAPLPKIINGIQKYKANIPLTDAQEGEETQSEQPITFDALCKLVLTQQTEIDSLKTEMGRIKAMLAQEARDNS